MKKRIQFTAVDLKLKPDNTFEAIKTKRIVSILLGDLETATIVEREAGYFAIYWSSDRLPALSVAENPLEKLKEK